MKTQRYIKTKDQNILPAPSAHHGAFALLSFAANVVRRPRITVAAALFFGSVIGAYAVVTPFSCLFRVSKLVSGTRTISSPTPYSCGTTTNIGSNSTNIALTLNGSSTASCDEFGIPNGSVLKASGQFEQRSDSLAQFAGTFTITSPDGAVLFSGKMDLMDSIDAHHPPMGGEPCNPFEHAEGWIDGTSPSTGCLECPTYKIHALLDVTVRPAPISSIQQLTGNLDGIQERNPSD